MIFVITPFGIFLSTPSARRATQEEKQCHTEGLYFYPRPPRGGRLKRDGRKVPFERISIHALREEGDSRSHHYYSRLYPISIHALREEGDYTKEGRVIHPNDFYPRPPRGGRLPPSAPFGTSWKFLSTPSARRATCRRETGHPAQQISIHALREEGDSAGLNSTSTGQRISIHALREEGDVFFFFSISVLHINFYPRPPRGGRLPWCCPFR